ncbi:MAG: NAD(P)-binding protein, partial [Cyanobacteriota bacterium]
MGKIIVIGGGIGGLTCGALLAEAGYAVTLYEQAQVLGGCASTFRRGPFIFDVGATQVAGLEPGGIHWRVFQRLGLPVPPATDCDPACAVFLPGESEPINLWRDPERWRAEREHHFPGSEPFWRLLQTLFDASWRFQGRDPVVPPRSPWDLGQLLQAFAPDTWITAPFSLLTVGDALRLLGLGSQRRLKTFLDLQLKLYSQVGADETALLYGATALSVSQAPKGLFHLQGSMQVLSDSLAAGLEKFNGRILTRRRVEKIHSRGGRAVGLTVRDLKTGVVTQESADQIVANVTVQDLVKLLDTVPFAYQQRVSQLASPSGAFVLYLGVTDAAISPDCPPHLQFLYDPQGPVGENNSLFVSVSKPGD